MNSYKFSVIVPIIYLTDISRKCLELLCQKAHSCPLVYFVLSCSNTVESELISIYKNFKEPINVTIVKADNISSNYLRYIGLKYAITDYVYYQDCDDVVDYSAILDNFHYCDGNNVVCFNIRRRQFDLEGHVKDDRLLYPDNSYAVKDIDSLMTNIVNKLIPKKTIIEASFYNIPFTQDLSLSFQIFEMCPHFYCAEPVYLYENNSKSTAGIKKTKRESLLRVVAVERILLRIVNDKNIKAYIKYRYENIIQGRFAFLRECYMPSLSLRAINPCYFGIRNASKHLFHYLINYYSCINIFIRNLLRR